MSVHVENDQLCLIFAAAVVNRQFREMLVKNPEEALKRGYLGQRFKLSRGEREKITSEKADTLSDLAKRMTE